MFITALGACPRWIWFHLISSAIRLIQSGDSLVTGIPLNWSVGFSGFGFGFFFGFFLVSLFNL
jgi:hypothetical protein